MANFDATLQLDEPADNVHARLVAALSHSFGNKSGYQLSASPGLIVVIHRYRPGWAIALAIIGTFLFLLGLLFLLVKDTETLTITLTSRGDAGSTVVVAGHTDDWVIVRVQRTLTEPAPPASGAGVALA